MPVILRVYNMAALTYRSAMPLVPCCPLRCAFRQAFLVHGPPPQTWCRLLLASSRPGVAHLSERVRRYTSLLGRTRRRPENEVFHDTGHSEPPRPFPSEIYVGEYERHVGGVGGRQYLFQDGEWTQRHVLFMWQSAATPLSFKHFYEYLRWPI